MKFYLIKLQQDSDENQEQQNNENQEQEDPFEGLPEQEHDTDWKD